MTDQTFSEVIARFEDAGVDVRAAYWDGGEADIDMVIEVDGVAYIVGAVAYSPAVHEEEWSGSPLITRGRIVVQALPR